MTCSRQEVWKSNRGCLGLVIAALCLSPTGLSHAEEASPSWNESIGLNGSLRQGYWLRDRHFQDDRSFPVSGLWLTLRPPEFAGMKLYMDAYTQASDLGRKKESKSDLREVYVESSFGSFDVRLGRMITVWGRADKVNPTDQLSLKRLGLLTTDDEDQRTGLLSSQVTYNFGNARLIAVWQPDWRESKFPMKSTSGVAIQEPRPDSFRDQAAFKIDQSGGAIDWSLSFFRGLSKSPDLELVNVGPSGVELDLVYRRVDVYGADFASNLGDMAIRGEFAYTRQLSDNWHDDPLKQKNQFFGTLGADRNLFENFNLNAQLLYKRIYGFQDSDALESPALSTLAQQLQLNSGQFGASIWGFTSRASYILLNDNLESEIAYVRWIERPSGLLRPKISYAVTDHFKAIAGGEVYFGDDQSYFGRFKEWKTVFTEVRYIF